MSMDELVDKLLQVDDGLTFSSLEEEVAYYRQQNGQLRQALQTSQTMMEEYRAESHDYEEELEHTLEMMESQNKELRGLVSTLQGELDQWKAKYQNERFELSKTNENLHRQVTKLTEELNATRTQYRLMEQENDDLERSTREQSSGYKDLEQRVVVLVERNSALEHEAEQKAKLVVAIQRLKDELQDAQLEIGVLKKKNEEQQNKRNSLRKVMEDSHKALMTQRKRTSTATMSSNASTMSLEDDEEEEERPKQQKDPMKAVKHMLNRVKVLENRLVNCRSLVNPLLEPPPTYEVAVAAGRRRESGVVLDKALAEQLVEERLKMRLQMRKERGANSGSESASSESSRKLKKGYNSSLGGMARRNRTASDF